MLCNKSKRYRNRTSHKKSQPYNFESISLLPKGYKTTSDKDTNCSKGQNYYARYQEGFKQHD